MNPLIASENFTPGTSRNERSRHTLALQMARAMQADQRLAVGERIKQLRGPRTQQPIADHVGVTLRAYQAWEAGGGIAWPHLEKLADYFNVSTNYLLYGQSDPPTPDQSQLDRIEERLEQLIGLLTESDEDESVRDALRRLQDTVASQSPPAPVRSASARAGGRRKSA